MNSIVDAFAFTFLLLYLDTDIGVTQHYCIVGYGFRITVLPSLLSTPVETMAGPL